MYIPERYRVVRESIENFGKVLDGFAKEGWRVVSAELHPNGSELVALLEKK
jgi:hypothetical protein